MRLLGGGSPSNGTTHPVEAQLGLAPPLRPRIPQPGKSKTPTRFAKHNMNPVKYIYMLCFVAYILVSSAPLDQFTRPVQRPRQHERRASARSADREAAVVPGEAHFYA